MFEMSLKCWISPARLTYRARRSVSWAPSRPRSLAFARWTWSSVSRMGMGGAAGRRHSCSRSGGRLCRIAFGDLPIDVDEIAGEQLGDLAGTSAELREGAGRYEL